MKKSKLSRDEGVSIKNIKMEEAAVLKILCKLYNACLRSTTMPEQWDKVITILLHKKGGKACLLSQTSKLFIRIITRRLTTKFDLYQSNAQAGFRKSYDTKF